MSSVKDVAHGSRRNAYTALILSTLAMIVCLCRGLTLRHLHPKLLRCSIWMYRSERCY